jgi:hypothetical protein
MRKIFLPPELYLGIEKMDDCIKGKLFDLVYRYNLWLDYVIPKELEIVFWFFKPFFDNDIQIHKQFCISRRENWKKWGRPIASFVDNTNNPSKKPKEATKPTKPTEVKWSDIYTSNIEIVSNIKEEEKEKLRKEFPNKNLEVEIKKMCNSWAGNNKQIKKPLSALRNWLLPKKRENDYIQDITEKTDKQRIEEFLAGKMKFYEKYWYPKYEEVKDKRIAECLRQPLSLN